MAKLSRRQRMGVISAANLLREAIRWIQSAEVEVCVVTKGTTTIEYRHGERYLLPINKQVGSRLQFLETAHERLAELIAENDGPPIVGPVTG